MKRNTFYSTIFFSWSDEKFLNIYIYLIETNINNFFNTEIVMMRFTVEMSME